MKISVTGASGQVGVCLVKSLVQEGHQVKVMIYDSKKGLENLGVELFNGNTLLPDDCDALCCDAEAVFHLAALIFFH